MNPKFSAHCPRCGCGLVPVHHLQEGRRTVVALTCPEPYCGHLESTSELDHTPDAALPRGPAGAPVR